jgi:mannose-6-phosphate isomerase-like protein (cupin superfamily)
MKNVIQNLIEESQKFFFKRAKIDDKIGLEAVNFAVRDIPKPIGKFEKSDSPLIRYIGEAIKHGNPETADLLKALEPALPYLPWKYNYEPRPDMPDLADQMGWGEILGPEAPYHDEHFCFGFTLLGKNTFYPSHLHPATELYVILSGHAIWTLDGISKVRGPGEFVLHPSNHIHSMQTEHEPMLALYTWSGKDVKTLSKYV